MTVGHHGLGRSRSAVHREDFRADPISIDASLAVRVRAAKATTAQNRRWDYGAVPAGDLMVPAEEARQR